MQITRGMVVRSGAGHDSGGFFVVLSLQGGEAFIADGKLRTLEKPKRKNVKHLFPTVYIAAEEDMQTDRKIRNVLWKYNYGKQEDHLPPENQGG